MTHYGLGEAAHQQVHQAGAAVCTEYQQVCTVVVGVVNQVLRHFARAFVGNQQVFHDVFNAAFTRCFFCEIQNFVTLSHCGGFVAFVLQEFRSQSHVFCRVGNVNQSQLGFVEACQFGGVFQCIEGGLATVNGYNQMFVHIYSPFAPSSGTFV